VKTNDDDDLRSPSLLFMDVPFGELKKPFCLNITIPSDARVGDDLDVVVKASKGSDSPGGQVTFITGQLAKVFIEVKGSGEAEQLLPPDEWGVVPNETADVNNDLQHVYTEEELVVEGSVGDNTVLLYLVLFVAGFLVTVVVVVLARKYEVVE
jgi:hypothetical protein